MLSSSEILSFLRKNKEYLRSEYQCSEIGLFGSFVRNEQTMESDIDILVSFEENAPDLYSKENNLKEYLKKHFGRNIDICSKKWIKPIFRPLVLNEVIYA